MPHVQQLYQWTERVQSLFPDLKPHHARDLAHYSFGAVLARGCGLTQVAALLAGLLVCSFHTIRARLRELYLPAGAQKGAARSAFDYTLCFGPLGRWSASSAAVSRRLVLALDPTCHIDRFRVLAVSVLYQGNGIPVAWAVQRAEDKGSWNDIWVELLGQLRRELGAGWTVLVLTDRGLESAELFGAITELGWHPLMRAKAGGKFRPAGWRKGYARKHFAASAGRRWAGAGVAYPTGAKLACTLLACWEEGHQEAWLILTDLPASASNPAWYALRMWIEQGFQTIKSGCWQWQHTRMEEAERAARLWAVLALATLWMIEVAGEGEPLELPEVPPRRLGASWSPQPKRRERLVKVGLRVVLVALIHGVPLPEGKLGQPSPLPPRDWEPDPLTEEMMEKC